MAKRMKMLLTVGRYRLSMFDQADFWLSNKDGEGMSLSRRRLEEIFHKHFKKNF